MRFISVAEYFIVVLWTLKNNIQKKKIHPNGLYSGVDFGRFFIEFEKHYYHQLVPFYLSS